MAFQDSRAGRDEGAGVSGTGEIFFTPTVDLSYTLGGNYSMIGSHDIRFLVVLKEAPGSGLFSNEQWSFQTPDESFALGERGGDIYNSLDGRLTGVLEVGKQYELRYEAYLWLETGDLVQRATAEGVVTLSFSPTAPPPPPPIAEPLTMAGVALSIAGLGGYIRKRRMA